MKDIYTLKLNEYTRMDTSEDSFITILRVPGGWIFTEHMESFPVNKESAVMNLSSVFVPYNEEFHPMHNAQIKSMR